MALPEMVHMAGMGLLTSVVAPALTVLGRRVRQVAGLARLGWWMLPPFVVVHAVVTLVMGASEPPLLIHSALDVVLLGGAVCFWLPVLGPTSMRLDDVSRCIYLLLAAMSLDLPAVVLVARGAPAGGLAMIVAMLPIGLAAVALFWRAAVAEEAAVRRAERSDGWTMTETATGDT
jgi:cytochrome c oxidase assembly factor CtaG